jgi:hypothetical protein
LAKKQSKLLTQPRDARHSENLPSFGLEKIGIIDPAEPSEALGKPAFMWLRKNRND